MKGTLEELLEIIKKISFVEESIKEIRSPTKKYVSTVTIKMTPCFSEQKEKELIIEGCDNSEEYRMIDMLKIYLEYLKGEEARLKWVIHSLTAKEE